MRISDVYFSGLPFARKVAIAVLNKRKSDVLCTSLKMVTSINHNRNFLQTNNILYKSQI